MKLFSRLKRRIAAMFPSIHEQETISTLAGGDLLFFTYADLRYHVFVALYPIFALSTNENSYVEICLSDFELFRNVYGNIIDFYEKTYPGKVLYRGVETRGIFPNSVRFLVKPRMACKYVYIGDVDILLVEKNIVDYHTQFMRKYNCDFSNVLRNEHQLTGLHFMEYAKMYPLSIPKGTDLLNTNDEVLLCRLMREKQCRFPPLGLPLCERKTHGLHASLSRPLLATLTTKDQTIDFPAWSLNPNPESYFDVRYSPQVTEFMKCIEPLQLELRRVVQTADIYAYYMLHEKSN